MKICYAETEGHGNPLQYSCLENSRDRGAWNVTVHRVAKSQTQLKQLSTHTTEIHDISVLLNNYKVCAQSVSHVWLFRTAWTGAHQALLSMEFSRQEYWSGLPFPLQGMFPTQGWNLHLLHWQADSLSLSHMVKPIT